MQRLNPALPPFRLFLAALALALLPLSASAQSTDTSNPIIARMAALVEAFNAQDVQTIAAIYAEDAVLLPPGRPSIVGRQAIAQEYAQAFAQGARDMQFQTFDIRGFDQNAVEIGETVSFVGSQRVVGRYMHLWEVVDGQILLTRDMYHILLIE